MFCLVCLLTWQMRYKKKLLPKRKEQFRLPERMVQIKITLDQEDASLVQGQINSFSKLENSGGDPVPQTRIQRRTPKLSYSCQRWDTNAWLRILYVRTTELLKLIFFQIYIHAQIWMGFEFRHPSKISKGVANKHKKTIISINQLRTVLKI